MTCRTFRQRAMESSPAAARQALAPELETHRRACPRCAAAWTADRELQRQLDRLRSQSVTVDVRSRVLARLREMPLPDAAVRPARKAAVPALIAGAALAIALLIGWHFPGAELATAWQLAAEQVPQWLAWALQSLVRSALALARLAGALLLDTALMLTAPLRWMRQVQSVLPNLLLLNGLMALFLATAVAALLRRLPAPRRLS